MDHGRRIGFGNEVSGAQVKGPALDARVAELRHENDGNMLESQLTFERFADGVAIDAGHLAVQQDQIRAQAARQPKGLLAARGKVDFAQRGQRPAQDADGGHIIVNDQQPGQLRAGHRSRHGPGPALGCPAINELAVLQLRTHAGDELRGDQRFADKIDRTHVKGGHLQQRGAVTGDKDHRHARQGRVGLERLADIQPAHAGHFSVQQNQVGHQFARQAQCLLPGRGKALVGKLRQHTADDADRARVVVNQ